MKFKNKYNKKNVGYSTKIIILSMFINALFINITVPSVFAGTLSDDGRYESFEGESISIDDVVEDSNVDVELEGNTLFNIVNHKTPPVKNNECWNYDLDTRTGSTNLVDRIEKYKTIRFELNRDVDLTKQYTLFINITKNTLVADNGGSRVGKIEFTKEYGATDVYEIQTGEIGIIKYLFNPAGAANRSPNVTIPPDVCEGEFEFKDFMIIEGNHMDKSLSFFEGLTSVGEQENNNLELYSHNRNIIDLTKLPYEVTSQTTVTFNNGVYTIEYVDKNYPRIIFDITHELDRLRGKEVTATAKFENSNEDAVNIIYLTGYDEYGNYYYLNNYDKKVLDCLVRLEAIVVVNNSPTKRSGVAKVSDIQLEYGLNKSEYSEHKMNSKNIPLKEPLRSLPNGVKDRIVKINNQWYVERNCWQETLTGYETYHEGFDGWPNKVFGVDLKYPAKYIDADTVAWDSDMLTSQTTNDIVLGGNTGLCMWEYFGYKVYVDVGKDTMEETIEYIKENNITYIYELAIPIYEPIRIDISANIYEGLSYISSNVNIKPNIKVTIDRTANRAMEAIEVAKTNPTVENIEQARMWVNMLENTIIKDSLQDSISDITNISGLELEKKKVSANIDMYIKPENSISMSLSTNSITFDNYTGLEDIEKLGALNITINSSLPYDLNAYMPKELSNADGSSSMGINLLNIRDNTESSYSQFADTTNKVVLKSDCDKGNNKQHTIDLKLASDRSYKSDIYKTVIKFEAEQK